MGIYYLNFSRHSDKLPQDVLPYYSVKHELFIQENIILKGNKIVARQAIREEHHSAHLGLESSLCLTRESICQT